MALKLTVMQVSATWMLHVSSCIMVYKSSALVFVDIHGFEMVPEIKLSLFLWFRKSNYLCSLEKHLLQNKGTGRAYCLMLCTNIGEIIVYHDIQPSAACSQVDKVLLEKLTIMREMVNWSNFDSKDSLYPFRYYGNMSYFS